MEKISLEDFRRIRDIIGNIVRLIDSFDAQGRDDYEEEMLKQYPDFESIYQEYMNLSNKDLSNIPAEEYKGFYDVGISFEGTGAKLDFNYIDISHREGIIRAKGCEVKNFPFTPGLYDEDSFEPEVLEQFKDKFLDIDLPKDVAARYYLGRLSASDVIKYNLYDVIKENKGTKDTKQFFDRVDKSIIEKVNSKILENYDIMREIVELIKEQEDEITEEVFIDKVKEAIKIELENSYISYEQYEKIRSIEGIEEYYPESKLIDFKGNDTLYNSYRSRGLKLEDVIENKELFRGKLFVDRIFKFESKEQDFSEEQLYFILDNYSELADVLSKDKGKLENIAIIVNPEDTKEENDKKIRESIMDIYSNLNYSSSLQKEVLASYIELDKLASKLDGYAKNYYDELRESYSEEEISKYGIPKDILIRGDVLEVIHLFGIDKVMEFDRQNGNVFTKDNYRLLKTMQNTYFHYASNNHDPNTNLNIPIQNRDLDELFRRMIKYGPTDFSIKIRPIDFRDFSKEFKEKYPEMFISEDLPEDLQDLFYKKELEPAYFIEHPEYIDYFEGKDLSIGLDIPEFSYRDEQYKYYNFFDMLALISDNSIEQLEYLINQEKNGSFKILKRFNSKIKSVNFSKEEKENMSFEKLSELLESTIEEAILEKRIPYGEDSATKVFKEKHPEMFLAEDAPEELKRKFYSYYEIDGENNPDNSLITIEYWLDEENFKYFEGKDLSFTNIEVKANETIELFNVEELRDMLSIDKESIVFYLNDSNRLNKFSNIIKNYPNNFAKEAICEELKISLEELEAKLLSGDKYVLERFEKEEQKYREQIIKSPGFVLMIPDEEKSRKSLKEYRLISENNMLKASNRYNIETYEQILANAYMFLGYDEARKLFEVPNIDEETLDRIYEQDELIKSLYEKKFVVKGDLKVVSKMIETMPSILSGNNEKLTSKNTLKIFKNINDQIQNGYDGDIKTLVINALQQNNMLVDEEKINEFSKALISISTSEKLDLVREKNSNEIDQNFQENEGTRRMIKMLYRNAMEYSLTNSEKIDPILVRKYFETEFSKVNDMGLPYYSEHVSGHLEEFVEMARELSQSPTWSKKLNHTIVDDIRQQSNAIGKGWIRKIVNYACNQPEYLTYEQIMNMEKNLYPEGSDIEIDADSIVTVKELSKEEKEEIYRVLSTGDYAGLLTYSKAENMFSTRNVQYSNFFRDFFIKNKDAFLSNPKLFTNFQFMNNRFDSLLANDNVRIAFETGKLDPKDIMLLLESDPYPNLITKEGDDETLYVSKKACLEADKVKKALEVMEQVRQREYQTIPPEEATIDSYRGKILRIDDPRHFTVGKETHCCQKFGDGEPGESSMLHSATERNGSEFIIEKVDEKGDSKGIMTQSWVWRNGNRVTFDNVEIPHDIELILKQEGGFDKLMDIYVEAAKKMVETDRRKIDALLKVGKITEEQARRMEIKEVTMGTGCDDLIHNLSKEKREEFSNATVVRPLEYGKTYTGFNSRALYTDSESSLVLYHNDNYREEDHQHRESQVGDFNLRYYRTRDILRRNGTDIRCDVIKKITERGLNKEDSILNLENLLNSVNLGQVNIDMTKNSLSMGENGDWYILYDKSQDGQYRIYEGTVDQTQPESEIDKIDRKMALGEYTREMYNLFLEAVEEGRSIKIFSEDLMKLLPVEGLIQDGIVDIKEASATVMDAKKLQEKVIQLNEVLEAQRRDRILIPQEKITKKEDKEDKESKEESKEESVLE